MIRTAAALLCLPFLLLPTATSDARPFHLVVCETPPGGGGGQPVERFRIEGTGGAVTRLSDIPGNVIDDPASAVFRDPIHLLVANRSNNSGNSVISTFTFDPDYLTFVQGPPITGNGVTHALQLTFNPVDGELFAVNWPGLVSRFLFDDTGNAVPNGTVLMPDNEFSLGVAVREANQDLFVSSYSFIRRFVRQPDETYIHVGNFVIPGGNSTHYMRFRGDELYVGEIATNAVYRFTFDPDGVPVPNGSVGSPSPIDVAFSPDEMEMLVASHLDGDVRRYLYDEGNDDWVYHDVIDTPSLGGMATMLMCIGDLDQDLDVDQADLGILLAAYNQDGGGDLDGDGDTDQADLGLLLATYGSDCN